MTNEPAATQKFVFVACQAREHFPNDPDYKGDGTFKRPFETFAEVYEGKSAGST